MRAQDPKELQAVAVNQSTARANRHAALVAILCLVVLSSCGGEPGPAEFASRTLSVLVGGGEGTSSLNGYYPRMLEIRAGDTVNWKNNVDGDDPHTVSFSDNLDEIVDIIPRPGGGPFDSIFAPTLLAPTRKVGAPIETYNGTGYFNSGIMFGYEVAKGIPIIDEFSLKFDTPGEYPYICGIHEFHTGVIVVEESTAIDLPNQRQIDTQAQGEMRVDLRRMDGMQEALVKRNVITDQEPRPDGTTTYIVSAGMGPAWAEVLEFIPKNVTIKEGDTVTWVSSRFHSVVFNPGGPFPPFYVAESRGKGQLPLLIANGKVLAPARPAATFDGKGFWSSGLMGHGQRPGGVGFTLTFGEPGRYSYMCPIHLGMVGTVTVEDG